MTQLAGWLVPFQGLGVGKVVLAADFSPHGPPTWGSRGVPPTEELRSTGELGYSCLVAAVTNCHTQPLKTTETDHLTVLSFEVWNGYQVLARLCPFWKFQERTHFLYFQVVSRVPVLAALGLSSPF